MQLIGGEIEHKQDNLSYYFTDSGRSSLRLILKSPLKQKRFLLPDFLCPVIIDIFKEANVSYDFYHIGAGFSIDWEEVNRKEFEVFYLINYFGNKYQNLSIAQDKVLLEDNVFFYDFQKPEAFANWISFNSYRKTSFLADGSLIKSTVKLEASLISKEEPAWAKLRYTAKAIKHKYIVAGLDNLETEKEYLQLTQQSEEELEAKKIIQIPSFQSLYNLQKYDRKAENNIQKENYHILQSYLGIQEYQPKATEVSHFLYQTSKREAIKEYLAKNRVFLPAFWPVHPELTATNNINQLYNNMLAIPIDSRYAHAQMLIIAKLIHSC